MAQLDDTIVDGQLDHLADHQRLAAKANYRFDVKDFGAIGDGAVDDTVAIQAADTAATPDGTVWFPPGVYLFGESGVFPSTGTKWVGSGQGVTTLKKAASAGGPGVYFVEAGGKTALHSLTIDMNKANTTDGGNSADQMGIYVYAAAATGCPDVELRDVEIKNGHKYGIRVAAADPSYPLGVTVANCHIHDVDQIGVYGYAVDRLVVDSNRFDNCGVADDKETIWVSGVGTTIINHNVRITGNLIENGGWHGILVGWADHFVIKGNIVKNCSTAAGTTGWGINATEYAEDFVISGNVVSGCGEGGIACDVARTAGDTTAYETRAVVSNNVCKTGAASHGIFIQRVSAMTITGNVSEGNASSGLSMNNCKDLAVVGNHLSDNGGYGISIFDGGTCTNGGNHLVAGNVYRDNTVGEFYDGQAPIPSRRMDGTRESYTPSNVSTDRVFDADTVTVAELADVVGTLIADLGEAGVVST